MVEVINGVKNLKQIYVGKGLKSIPIVNKASGLKPVINKRKIKKKKIGKGLKILE